MTMRLFMAAFMVSALSGCSAPNSRGLSPTKTRLPEAEQEIPKTIEWKGKVNKYKGQIVLRVLYQKKGSVRDEQDTQSIDIRPNMEAKDVVTSFITKFTGGPVKVDRIGKRIMHFTVPKGRITKILFGKTKDQLDLVTPKFKEVVSFLNIRAIRSVGAVWEGRAGVAGLISIDIVVPTSGEPVLEDYADFRVFEDDNAEKVAIELEKAWDDRDSNKSYASRRGTDTTVYFEDRRIHRVDQYPKKVKMKITWSVPGRETKVKLLRPYDTVDVLKDNPDSPTKYLKIRHLQYEG